MQSAGTVLDLTFFPQQWKAVAAPIEPILVLAGPGAGKTRCLIGRIGYLLTHHHAAASRICAITFTNKAANEIRARLRGINRELVERLCLSTFHRLCLDILRAYGRRVGLPSDFHIATKDHQALILSRFGVPTKQHNALLLRIGRHRLGQVALSAEDQAIYTKYARELRSQHLIDFDEILTLTHILLRDTPIVLSEVAGKWDHILIDEFQDLDPTQYAILRLLAQSHRSLFAVGDDDQSIYTFRGADVQVIQKLITDFEILEPIILDKNCRSTKPIFVAARKVLPTNDGLFEKEIEAIRDGSPDAVVCRAHQDEHAEAAWLVEEIRRDSAETRTPLGEYAILFRNNYLGNLIEENLVAEGIPCRTAKGHALSDDPTIGKILAALRIALAPETDIYVEDFARFCFDDLTYAGLRKATGKTFLDKVRHAVEEEPQDAARMWRFLYQVENLRGLNAFTGSVEGLIRAVLEQGIGAEGNPLEAHGGELLDPESIAGVRELADALKLAQCLGRTILIPTLGGLEVPLKLLLRAGYPELSVEYEDSPNLTGKATIILPLDTGNGYRIVRLFKALQYLKKQSFRKSLRDYVCFDLETTGRDVESNQIIELAAVKVRNGKVVDQFHSLVRATIPIEPGATAIHGYSDADIAKAPALGDLWPRFRAFVGNDLLVAHNGVLFDMPILKRQTAGWRGCEGLRFYDSLPLARQLVGRGQSKLEQLAERFGIDKGRAHHAVDDCVTLARVFERLQEESLKRAGRTCLSELLGYVALGAAVENTGPTNVDEQVLLTAAQWRDLRRHPAVVDAYIEEAEQRPNTPKLNELLRRIDRLSNEWQGRATEQPEEEFPLESAIDRLVRLARRLEVPDLHESIRSLFDKVSLSISEGPEITEDRVNLITFHSTKGLEFRKVFVIGLEENTVPGTHALSSGNAAEIKEARRLLYVAMTRAKDQLTLSWCAQRNGRPGGPPRFLIEAGLVEQANEAAIAVW